MPCCRPWRKRDGAEPFDLPGFLLSGVGFALFMSGIELASRNDVSVPGWTVPAMLAAAITLIACAGAYLRRARQPLFGLAPLGIATFRITAVGESLFRTSIATAPFLLPLMFQVGFGWGAAFDDDQTLFPAT